jgi:hypothetical protein
MLPAVDSRRLEVETDLDPGNLIRILHFFQTRNVTPVRVYAQCVAEDTCVITVDVEISDLSLDVMKGIAAKIAEMPFAIRSTVRESDF